MTQKTKFYNFICLIIILSATTPFMLNSIHVQAAEQGTGTLTINQDFETPPPHQDWDYAHADHFQRSSSYVKQGAYSLKAEAVGVNGITYDGVQYYSSFEDGYIEAWVYAQASQYGAPGLWLRTSTNDGTGSVSFKDGYMLRIYRDYARIFHVTYDIDTPVFTTLTDTEYLGLIHNKWWHMKFKVTSQPDSSILLEGWVTTSSVFDANPDLSVSITDTSYKLSEGKAGFSARTNLQPSRHEYFDAVKLEFDYPQWEEGFESADYIDDWDIGNSDRFTRTTAEKKSGAYSLKASGPDGIQYDGALFQDSYFSDGKIEAWVYPKTSNYHMGGLWLRASHNLATSNPTIRDGYLLRLYMTQLKLFYVNDGVFTLLEASENLGYISGRWWHLKLEAEGTMLYGYASKDEQGYSGNPELLFSHDTNLDSVKYSFGRAGFSARTTMSSSHPFYIDDIKIQYLENNPNNLITIYSPSQSSTYNTLLNGDTISFYYHVEPGYSYTAKIDGFALPVLQTSDQEILFDSKLLIDTYGQGEHTFEVIIDGVEYKSNTFHVDPVICHFLGFGNALETSYHMDSDVETVAELLESEYARHIPGHFETNHLWTDSDVTSAVYQLDMLEDENDIVFILFVTHGTKISGTYYIWSPYSDLNNLVPSIDDTELFPILSMLDTNKLILIIQTCYSEGMLQDYALLTNECHLIAVCEDSEISWAYPGAPTIEPSWDIYTKIIWLESVFLRIFFKYYYQNPAQSTETRFDETRLEVIDTTETYSFFDPQHPVDICTLSEPIYLLNPDSFP